MITVATRKNGEPMVFRVHDEGLSLNEIRTLVSEEVNGARPILIGIKGGHSSPSSNDNDIEPSIA